MAQIVPGSAGAIDVNRARRRLLQDHHSATVGDKDVTVPSDASAANVIDLHAEVGHISLRQG